MTKYLCDHCGTQLVDMCLRCGAPVCCPKCCIESNSNAAATSPQAAQTDEREAFEAFTKLEHNCVPKWDDAQGAYAVFEYDMMFDAFKAGRAGRKE